MARNKRWTAETAASELIDLIDNGDFDTVDEAIKNRPELKVGRELFERVDNVVKGPRNATTKGSKSPTGKEAVSSPTSKAKRRRRPQVKSEGVGPAMRYRIGQH